MADQGYNGAVPEGPDQPQRVADQVEHAEGAEVAVVVTVPARGAPVTPLVRGDHVVAGRGQRQHHLPPTVRKLGEAVQQQDAGPVPALEAGFQHVHRQSVAVVHEAGTYAGRESPHAVGSHVSA